jgi:hypothetical protein
MSNWQQCKKLLGTLFDVRLTQIDIRSRSNTYPFPQ